MVHGAHHQVAEIRQQITEKKDDEKERNGHMMRILQGLELVGRRGSVKDSGKDVCCQ